MLRPSIVEWELATLEQRLRGQYRAGCCRGSRSTSCLEADRLRPRLCTSGLTRPERLEGDDGKGVLDARNDLHLLVDEVADVGVLVDIELDQEVVLARGGVDLRGDLGLRKRIGDHIGLAELALDLDEKRNHRGRLRDKKRLQ